MQCKINTVGTESLGKDFSGKHSDFSVEVINHMKNLLLNQKPSSSWTEDEM